jgi:adenosylhomocysteine nucleosidase
MIGIIVAMNNESETLLSQMKKTNISCSLKKNIIEGEFEGEQIVIIISGIGKVNAAISTQFLIDNYKINKLLNLGLAGGIGKDIEIGDVFFIEKAVQYDFDLSLINDVEIGRLEDFEDKYILVSSFSSNNFLFKKLATGDRFNEDKNDEKLLTDYMKADLRDMEGGAIAQVATLNEIPLFIVKAVSDKIEKDSISSYFEQSTYALKKLKEKMKEIFTVIK